MLAFQLLCKVVFFWKGAGGQSKCCMSWFTLWLLPDVCVCVCVLFIEQSQLPRGETALRVFAQQVGPHQAADSRFWPAPGTGLELRARHTISTLISIESGVTNQVVGASNMLSGPPPPQLLPPEQLWLPDFNSSPLPSHAPVSFLSPFLLFNSTGFVFACNLENLCWTLPFPPYVFLFFCFFFAFILFFSLSSCGISNHWTSGRGYLHVWSFFFFFFLGWEGGFNSSDLLKGFIIKAKKRTKKVFFERRVKY